MTTWVVTVVLTAGIEITRQFTTKLAADMYIQECKKQQTYVRHHMTTHD